MYAEELHARPACLLVVFVATRSHIIKYSFYIILSIKSKPNYGVISASVMKGGYIGTVIVFQFINVC